MDNASFGFEHIFREFGQIYQAVQVHREKYGIYQNGEYDIEMLPHLVANLMLQGTAFELMDGDASFVPITWVQAVFDAIKETVGDKKLLIISVVGIQSSGKSTLLNTMFGLKFTVSAGRCTKGLYCQLIPVDKQSMDVEYDYIMVMDTEGLRAPELQETNRAHDNELATLVIGLSNITIINVKGENDSEMTDVLEIVIHALIRINLAKRTLTKPSCLFVHQNVSASDAEDKLKVQKEKLLTKLDQITRSAAEEEKVSHIHQFKDIITYDEHNYAFCMPDLWQGQPPFATVNLGYSDRVARIKMTLTQFIVSGNLLPAISSLTTRISDLWEAILSENFVFSFKNSEEVKAYADLDRWFTKLYWDFKDTSLNIQVACQNLIPSIEEESQLQEQEISLEKMVLVKLREKQEVSQSQLIKYFKDRENIDILEQWRGRYNTSLDNLCEDEQKRVIRVLHTSINNKIRQLETTSKANSYCREKILETAMEKAKELQQQSSRMSERQLSEYFQNEWPEWLKQFNSSEYDINAKELVIATFIEELNLGFSNQTPLLKKELKKNSLKHLDADGFDFDRFSTQLKKDDLHPFGKLKQFAATFNKNFNTRFLPRALDECGRIVSEIRSYVKGGFGRDFHPGHVGRVIEMLQAFFKREDDIKEDNGFTFEPKFRMRFIINMCKCSANEFIKIKEHFQNINNPLFEIQKRQTDFYNLFSNTYNNIAKEKIAAEWVKMEISNWLRTVTSTKLGPLILNVVVTDTTSCFDTKQTFLNRILIEIARTNNFKEFTSYLRHQNRFFADKVKEYVNEILNQIDPENNEMTKLEILIKNQISKLVSQMRTSLDQIARNASFVDKNDYFNQFLMKFSKDTSDSDIGDVLICPLSRLDILEKNRDG